MLMGSGTAVVLSNAKPLGLKNPEAKVIGVVVPAFISLIVLLLIFETKRLPLVSNARPYGPLSPEAKVIEVVVPAFISFIVVLPPRFATKKVVTRIKC